MVVKVMIRKVVGIRKGFGIVEERVVDRAGKIDIVVENVEFVG